MDTINKTLAQAYLDMYETKEVKTERKSWVPEAIADEDVADFMGAAAAAAKAGKKEFKFGDKTYKVTMKKDTVDAISDEAEVCEKCGKVHEGSCMKESNDIQEAVKVKPEKFKGKNKEERDANTLLTRFGLVYGKTDKMMSFEGPKYIDPKTGISVLITRKGKAFAASAKNGQTIQRPTDIMNLAQWLQDNGMTRKEEVKEAVDEAKKAKGKPLSQKQIKRALQSVKAQPKDKVSLKKAPWDESLDESPEEPRAKGEKDFKKMHDDNTEIVDEKDGEDETFDNIKKSADSIKK